MKKNFAKMEYILAMFIYGTIGCFSRFIDLPSGLIILSRGIIGVITISLFVIITKKYVSFKNIKDNLWWLILGGVSLGGNWILLFSAYDNTSVANACLCNYFAPAVFIIIASFIFKEKLTLVKITCAILAFLGLALVSGVFDGNSISSSDFKGILLGLGAAFFYVLLMIANKKLKVIASFDRVIVEMLIASIIMAPYAFITSDVKSLTITPLIVILVLILGVVHTGIAYTLYFGSMEFLSTQTISIDSYIEPVVSVFLSVVILKEEMGLLGFIGGLLILGSTLISDIFGDRRKTFEIFKKA